MTCFCCSEKFSIHGIIYSRIPLLFLRSRCKFMVDDFFNIHVADCIHIGVDTSFKDNFELVEIALITLPALR